MTSLKQIQDARRGLPVESQTATSLTRRFLDLPIRHKLRWIALMTSLLIILPVSAIYIYIDYGSTTRSVVSNFQLTARMAGSNAAVSMLFGDQKTAGETLQALENDVRIRSAALHDVEGDVFASWSAAEGTPAPFGSGAKKGVVIVGDLASICEPVMFEEQNLGTIYLRADLRERHHKMINSVLILLVLIPLATALAFLVFSRIEASEIVLEIKPFDLRELLEDVAELLSSKARERGLGLDLDFPVDTPRRVSGDAGRIRQILVNLIGNAIKFTEAGHIRVAARAETAGAGGATWLITVSDTGIGIDPATIGKLFDRFSQADNTITRRFGGTGLGLAISRQLARLMGGDVEATSVPGQGSTFCLRLELPVHAEQPQPQPIQLPGAAAGARVLLVETDEFRRGVVARNLLALGLKVDDHAGAASALSAWRTAGGASCRLLVVGSSAAGAEAETLLAEVAADRTASGSGTVVLRLGDQVGAEVGRDLWRDLPCIPIPLREKYLVRILAAALAGLETTPSLNPHDSAPALSEELSHTGYRASQPLVLLVEDNPTNQLVAAGMLRKLSCRVVLAADGREAVALVQEHEFDLVLMDCHMPAMDGYESTAAIRALPSPAAEVPIIALTASVLPEDRERAAAAGMDDFLSKPIKRELLADMFQRWGLREKAASADMFRAPHSGSVTGVQAEGNQSH